MAMNTRMKFVYNLSKCFILLSTISVLVCAGLFSLNKIEATHTDCTNWASLPDKDCDGLADSWEDAHAYQKTVNGNTITVNLPDGVNKLHRDVLVEIDYMSHHVPPASAINSVVDKYTPMELLNADGTNGVNLHYIIDDNVPHRDCIDVYSDSTPDPTIDSYTEYKENYLGTASERSSNPDFHEAKRDVYHYALFIHTQCGSTSTQQSSGKAEQPGNDIVVSLGYPGWGNIIDGHDTGSDEYKASTFMHELGHNLGLRHAGSYDLPHCKPNFISVMNYLYQFPSFVPTRPMDYSHNVVTSLQESALVESTGIGISSPSGLPVAVGHSTWSHSGSIPHTYQSTANNSPISYNWYKGDNDFSDTVSSSITNFHFSPCNDNDVTNTAVGGKLFGYDDVHYNSLTFWANSATYQDGSPNPALTSETQSNQNERSATDDDMPMQSQNGLQASGSPFGSSKNSKLLDCDMSVPGCNDSPCDRQDPLCSPTIGHNFAIESIEEQPVPKELTLKNVLQAINSKVFNINEIIQSLNQSDFTEGSNTAKIKNDIQNSLVNNPDSLYNLINSGNSDQALGEIYKLRSLVDGTNPGLQIIKEPRNDTIVKFLDDLALALEKKR